MTPRAVPALAFATVLLVLSYLSAFVPGMERAGAWGLVVALAVLCAALVLLADRGGRRRPLLVASAVGVGACLLAGFGYVLIAPEGDARAPALLFGLPQRTAVMLLVVGVIPLVGLPVVWALATADPDDDA